jgi:hypothetical protein
MSASREELFSKVEKWLARQGYPLELRVGRVLSGAGWNVQHSRYYRDLRSTKMRELDIFASRFHDPGKGKPLVGLALAIECKRSPDKPWVVLSSPQRMGEELFPSIVVVGEVATQAVNTFTELTKRAGRFRLLQSGARRGHGMVRVSFNDHARAPNAAYAALQTVTSATAAFAKDVDGFPLEPRFVQIILPVIVFDGALFELFLEDNGTEDLRQVDSAKVYSPISYGSGSMVLVNVVTVAGLDGLLQEANSDAIDVLPVLAERANTIVASARKT